MISRLFRLLLLVLAVASTIRLCGQTDSAEICLTGPEYDFYARALVERNHLQGDTALLRRSVSELRLAVVAKDQMLRADSLIIGQKGKIIVVQQDLLQKAAKDLSRQKGKTTFWKVVAGVAVVAGVSLSLR